MESIYIFGAGKIGNVAISCLSEQYNITAIIDNDRSKQGSVLQGIPIVSADVLLECKQKVIVACSAWEEIEKQLERYSVDNIEIFEYNLCKKVEKRIVDELNHRTINLGKFLYSVNNLFCKELTFMIGGSGVLDYFFIKGIAEKFGLKTYLEIGTYIGESINILSDSMDKLYSITAPLDAPFSMRSWCKKNNVPDYSERLTYSDKISHFFEDSRTFDYTKIPSDIDLFFIDGDHSYEGVFNDTINIFKIRKDTSIVIWHDFKIMRNQYNGNVIKAVRDVLGEEMFKNVYVTDNNICGIYIPDCFKSFFEMSLSTDNTQLYVYDTYLDMHIR